jgi:hypothetical protein
MSLTVSASAFGPVISHAKRGFLNKIMKSAPSASPLEKSHFHQRNYYFFQTALFESAKPKGQKA